MKKVLTIGIIFLLIVFSVIPIVNGKYIRFGNVEYMKVIENIKDHLIFFDNSPIAEIITPKNGSIVYNSSVNITVKFTDDNGITNYEMIYGTYNSSGGHGGGWSEPKKYYLFNKIITVVPGYNLIFATAYDEEGNVGHDFSVYYYYSNNPIPTDTPPKVEILIPENGSVVYDKNVSMHAKCTDDDGIVTFNYAYCGAPGGGLGGSGFTEPQSEYYYNDTIRAFTGYNWILAWAYDVNGSIGYDITLYRYDEMKTSFIIGVITDKKEMDNYTTFKARALLYLGFKPFTFNFYRSEEEIIISNCYLGYIGQRFIFGRFNAAINQKYL